MSFFGFYDTLNCAATAVNEDGSGRPAQAQAAWEAASTSARDLFPSGTDTPGAIAAILAAARPSGSLLGKADLWNALNAAALAVLPAMAGDAPETALLLNDLDAATRALSPELRDAMTVIAFEIGMLAMAGVTA